MATLTHTTELVVTTCWCGMPHAIPGELYRHQQRQHSDGRDVTAVYCPLGHTHIPAGEGKAAKLERQLRQARERAAAEADLRRDTERRLAAQKGETTKAKKRAAAAACPCCGRTFVQLRRHMAAKHPDYMGIKHPDPRPEGVV